MPTRVLVTGAGGAAAVSFLRALDPARYEVLAGDLDPCAVGLYMVPADRRFLLPRGDDPGYVDALLALCIEQRVSVLVPTVDCELLPVARARRRFRRQGVELLVCEPEALELCLDKWALVQACQGHVPVPTTELLTEAVDPAALRFPLIAKPRTGSGGRGVVLLQGPDDLTPLPRDGSLLLQEYLPGEEYSVDVLVSPGGIVEAAVPRARLRVDSGVAICARTLLDPELEGLSARVAAVAGLSLVANVQWRRDRDGRPRLLEVNARFPGTMPLTIAAGVDMPNLALEMVLGRPLPLIRRHREVALVRRWEEIAVPVAELDEMRGGDAATRARPAA